MNATNTPGQRDSQPSTAASEPEPSTTSTDHATDRFTDRITEATSLLRQHTDEGWKAIADSVIARAMTLHRPSAPVRGRHDLGDFFLASDVVISKLRHVIDAVPGAAAQKIGCTTGDRDELDAVTIQLIAAYGAPLLAVAERVHTTTLQHLREVLGALAPLGQQVHTHVHIGDVSNDPRIVH